MNPKYFVVDVECLHCGHFYKKQTLENYNRVCPECRELTSIVNVETNGETKKLVVELINEIVSHLSLDIKGQSAWRSLLESMRDGVRENWDYFNITEDNL